MPDSKSKIDHRKRKAELGMKGLTVNLDAMTLGYLDELVKASKLPKKGPSANAAVVSEAINAMYSTLIKKRPLRAKKHWFAQNVRIGSNTIQHLYDNNHDVKEIAEILNGNLYPSADWFTDEDTEWTGKLVGKVLGI